MLVIWFKLYKKVAGNLVVIVYKVAGNLVVICNKSFLQYGYNNKQNTPQL